MKPEQPTHDSRSLSELRSLLQQGLSITVDSNDGHHEIVINTRRRTSEKIADLMMILVAGGFLAYAAVKHPLTRMEKSSPAKEVSPVGRVTHIPTIYRSEDERNDGEAMPIPLYKEE